MSAGLIISCEHATNHVPDAYRHLFAEHPEVLSTHRGWDPGALPIAQALSAAFETPLISGKISRLLIEINRSPGNPEIWSGYSNPLPEATKQELFDTYYRSHETALKERIQKAITDYSLAIHLSIHTFTPVLDGVKRDVDLGILFDPDRKPESAFGVQFTANLNQKLNPLRVRENQPYKGTDDGLTTCFRKCFSEETYIGIEIEVSQRFESMNTITEALIHSLGETIGRFTQA